MTDDISFAVPVNSSGSESKPFRCSYCSKEFGHLSSLESHVERLHTNESKHHCQMCGRAFSSKSNLTAHKKIHTGKQ
jgi:KRAB domain-containing zinc finger protein